MWNQRLLVNIANLKTIGSLLHDEFLKQKDPDISIKICTCIELIDLLKPNENGYKIDYDKELKVSEATKKLKSNSIKY